MLTWVALIPKVIALISTIADLARAHQERGAGWDAAVAQALTVAAAQSAAAADELANAEKIHANDPTDGAFDKTFERKEP